MLFNLRLLTVLSLASTEAIAAPQTGASMTNGINAHGSSVVPDHAQHVPAVSSPAPSSRGGGGGGITVDPSHVYALMTNETHYDLHHARALTLDKRTGLGMYQCAKVGFQQPCTWDGPLPDGACRQSTWSGRGSMGPDKGLKCTVYKTPDCSGTGLYPFVFAGIFDFATDVWWEAVSCVGDGCLNAPLSYKCSAG